MKKILWMIAAALLAVTMGLTACGGKSKLEQAVKEALVSGDTTEAQFNNICAIVKANPEKYSKYIDESGEINMDALGKYINQVGAKLKPPVSWNVAVYGLNDLTLTVYFERSGSMVPYDSPSGGGQLKKAVNDLVNFFPSKRNVSINIVNDNIYPYWGTIDSFLQDRNIYETTKGMGNAQYTDFKLIFDKIFQAQKPNNVSVLVTDMIYSPQNTAGVSVEKIFNEENSLATSIFKQYRGKSMIVSQLAGDFDGMYYPYSGVPFQYKGKRPFYVIIIANTGVIDRMATDRQFAGFLKLDGVLNSYRFNQAQAEFDYKVLPKWKDDAGRFRPSRKEKGLVSDCEGDKETGRLCFSVAVNFSGLQKDDVFLSNVQNYTVQSRNGFAIKVRRILPEEVTGNNKRYLDGMSHIITFTGKLGTRRDEIKLSLRNDFPQWIAASTSRDDSSVAGNFAQSTFGLERFLRGIYDAFSGGENAYGHLDLKLEE